MSKAGSAPENSGLKDYEVFACEPSEIVIGLIGPLGTANEKILKMIESHLSSFGYASEEVRISRLIIPSIVGQDKIRTESKYARATSLIDLGNSIRSKAKNSAALAISVAAEIHRRRGPGAVGKTAYVVSSLKSKEEVSELRKIYGNGFYLFAIHTDRAQRISNLQGADGSEMTESDAVKLISRDEHESSQYGQHTRETFALADFFCADENDDSKLSNSIERCVNLIFGHPFVTPTFNEFAMFMAFATSLRSADLSRQVGAVVARDAEILSTGANDCPSPGGGLYWPKFNGSKVEDAPRGRDYMRGEDSNARAKEQLVAAILKQLGKEGCSETKEILEKTPIKDITEYGRVVHAEMEALLACARSNISCREAVLYCTTFPCHNCAKHIVAAGISEVVYVEPYPKSKAIEFHDDSIVTSKIGGGDGSVRFKPFIGVGPRQFFDLFSLALSVGRPVARKYDGKAVAWDPIKATPRVPMMPVSHRSFEEVATDYARDLRTLMEDSHGRST